MNETSLSQQVALIGTLFLALVFLFSIHSKLIASFFHGLHRSYHFHHILALSGTMLILIHVFLEINSLGFNPNSLLILFGDFSLITAWISLFIFVFVTIFSMVNITHKLWRKIHLITIFAWPILYWHFRDFSIPGLHQYMIFFLYGVGLFGIFRGQILTRFSFWGKKYKVKNLKKINNNTFELIITPLTKNSLRLKSCAQYFYLRFNQVGFSKEWHPFTCLTHPKDDTLDLKFAIKSLGHDTYLIDEKLINTIINVDGPYGDLHKGKFQKELWLVAGIGIGPLYSWTKDENFAKYSTRVVHFTNNEQEQIYTEYWSDLKTRKSNLDYRLWNSSVQGLINANELKIFLNGYEDADIFVVGSTQFIKYIRKLLKISGFSIKHIHSEEFIK